MRRRVLGARGEQRGDQDLERLLSLLLGDLLDRGQLQAGDRPGERVHDALDGDRRWFSGHRRQHRIIAGSDPGVTFQLRALTPHTTRMSIQTTADWKGLRRVARIVPLTLDALEGGVTAGVIT